MLRDNIRTVTGFARNFSHSEKAEQLPEVPIFNMGPSRQWGVRDLDAHGSAAAGRKLTLEQGLGADFRRQSAQIRRQSAAKTKGSIAFLPLAKVKDWF
jgi:hypothetical protein